MLTQEAARDARNLSASYRYAGLGLLSANSELSNRYIPSIDWIWKANQAQMRTSANARAIVQFGLDLPALANFRKEYQEAMSDMHEALIKYESLVATTDERDQLTKLKADIATWEEMQGKAVELWDEKAELLRKNAREKDLKAFIEFHDKLQARQAATRASFGVVDDSLDKLVDTSRKYAEIKSNDSANQGNIGRIAMVAIIVVGVSASLLIGLAIAASTLKTLGVDPSEISEIVKQVTAGDTSMQMRSDINFGVYADIRTMVQGLNEKAVSAEMIAKGDLTTEIKLASDRDRLGKAFRTMISVLRDIISRANSASFQVATGS